MFKLTYLALSAVAVFISNVSADDETGNCREDFKPLQQECLKELGFSNDDLSAALKARDPTLINPCHWGCLFKKLGLLDDKGQYDLSTGLDRLKKLTTNDMRYAKLSDTAKRCQTVQDQNVSDGDAGCERGALLAACFMKEN